MTLIFELLLGRTSDSYPAMNELKALEKLGVRILLRINEHWAAMIFENFSIVSGLRYNRAMYLSKMVRSSSESTESFPQRQCGIFLLPIVLSGKWRPMEECIFALGRSRMSPLSCNWVKKPVLAGFSSSPLTKLFSPICRMWYTPLITVLTRK